MNEGVDGRFMGVDRYEMACVRAVRRRALQTMMTCRALDKHGLTRSQLIKPFKEVDATQRDCLHRRTEVAGEGDFGEESAQQFHPVSQAGWLGFRRLPAVRNNSAIGS